MKTRNLIDYLQNINDLLLSKKTVFNVEEFSRYSGLSKSAIYKLTSERQIIFSRPNGKTIFFKRKNIESYLLRNQYGSICTDNIEKGGCRG